MRPLIAIALGIWFVLVVILGARGAFVQPPRAPPLPILVGATAPLMIFLAACVGSAAFRAWLLSLDVRLLTAVQAWRAGGLGFLALSAAGVLPELFAWPAGWGDIAIGVSAPWMVLALIRRPSFASGRLFAAWNIVGILDLVVAVSAGVLTSGFIPALAPEATTGAMSRLPLVVVPAFLVPLFVMMHAAALLQARRSVLHGKTEGPQGLSAKVEFGS